MKQNDHMAEMHLLQMGIQYYVAGRAAARCHLIPVTGILMHHSVEMLLKSYLSRTSTLEKIKREFGHDLVKLWSALKTNHPEESLDDFDELVSGLDLFEEIRYPDEYLKHGASMALQYGPPEEHVKPVRGLNTAKYLLNVNEVDTFVARLFRISRLNPVAYLGVLNREAIRFLAVENGEVGSWGISQP